jgi:hypothetical protein
MQNCTDSERHPRPRDAAQEAEIAGESPRGPRARDQGEARYDYPHVR